jgi:hypothetical protein
LANLAVIDAHALIWAATGQKRHNLVAARPAFAGSLNARRKAPLPGAP